MCLNGYGQPVSRRLRLRLLSARPLEACRVKCSFYVCECIGKMPNYSLAIGGRGFNFFGEGGPSPRIELRVKKRGRICTLPYFTLVPEYP